MIVMAWVSCAVGAVWFMIALHGLINVFKDLMSLKPLVMQQAKLDIERMKRND